MEKGQFRCDANVSLRRHGETRLGTRTEIKNLNSFRFVEDAIDAEIARQAERARRRRPRRAGDARATTRSAARTRVMRLKENADDYRYFPDPDLVPLRARPRSGSRRSAPRCRSCRTRARARFEREHGLSADDARLLTRAARSPTSSRPPRARTATPKASRTGCCATCSRALKERDAEIEALALTPAALAALLRLVDERPRHREERARAAARAARSRAATRRRWCASAVSRRSRTRARSKPRSTRCSPRTRRPSRRSAPATRRSLNFLMGQVMKRTGARPTRRGARAAGRAARAPMKWLLRAGLALLAALLLAGVALAVLAAAPDRPARGARRASPRRARRHRPRAPLRGARLRRCFPPRSSVKGVGSRRRRRIRRCAPSASRCSVALLPLLARTVVVDRGRGARRRAHAHAHEAGHRAAVRSAREAEATSRGPTAPGAGDAAGARRLGSRCARCASRSRGSRCSTARCARRRSGSSTTLDARARGRLGEDAPIEFELAAKLAGAPLARARARPASRARSTRSSRSTTFPLERLAPYLPRGSRARAGRPALELAPRGRRVDALRGPARAWTSRAPSSAAATSFRKPAGDRAAFAGAASCGDGDALRIEDGKLELRDVTLDVAADLAPRTARAALRSALRAVGLLGLAAGPRGVGRLRRRRARRNRRQLRSALGARRHGARPGERRPSARRAASLSGRARRAGRLARGRRDGSARRRAALPPRPRDRLARERAAGGAAARLGRAPTRAS